MLALRLVKLSLDACGIPGLQYLKSTSPNDWTEDSLSSARLDWAYASEDLYSGLRGSFLAADTGEHNFYLVAQIWGHGSSQRLQAAFDFDGSQIPAFTDAVYHEVSLYKDFR
jgi:hypothetical protein